MTERMCQATRQKLDKATMLRFVASPEGQIVLDIAHKLPGRGFHLLPEKEAYDKALKTKAFLRELEVPAAPPAWADIVAQLEKDALNRVGLAKKAGHAHPGWDAVKYARHLQGVLVATDAGKDIQNKILGLDVPCATLFNNQQLADILGLPAVSLVGISALHTWQALQKVAKARTEG